VRQRGRRSRAPLQYFEQVALDVAATREQLALATGRRRAEARALCAQGERELQQAEERLARVRRDYADGLLDAEDWRGFRDELGAEREAAEAKLALLREREREAVAEGEARDYEGELLERLADLRQAVAGQVALGDVAAVRAALQRLFECFTLHRLGEGGEPVELDLCLGGTYIEPRLRAEAIVGYEQVYAEDSARTLARPVLRPEALPLMARAPSRPNPERILPDRPSKARKPRRRNRPRAKSPYLRALAEQTCG